MNIRKHNRNAWNKQVEYENRWTVPVTSDIIDAVRNDEWKIVLTPTIPVPKEWFPNLNGAQVLCLASGGGLYEDRCNPEDNDLLNQCMPTFIATRADKPAGT
jgi:hypothetical protein